MEFLYRSGWGWQVRYCFDQYIASSARSAVECAIASWFELLKEVLGFSCPGKWPKPTFEWCWRIAELWWKMKAFLSSYSGGCTASRETHVHIWNDISSPWVIFFSLWQPHELLNPEWIIQVAKFRWMSKDMLHVWIMIICCCCFSTANALKKYTESKDTQKLECSYSNFCSRYARIAIWPISHSHPHNHSKKNLRMQGKIRSELPGIHFTNVGYAGSDACNVKPAIFVQSRYSAKSLWSVEIFVRRFDSPWMTTKKARFFVQWHVASP